MQTTKRPTIHPAKVHELAASLADDPLRLISLCWPDMVLYEKQEEILLSVRDNHETFVHAANQTGKTRIAAATVLWFFLSRTPARVVTCSSGETQLAAILWSEIKQLIATSRLPLPLQVNYLELRKRIGSKPDTTEALDYVLGHVPSQVENFQGHHLVNDKPRVLVVVDEASGVPDEIYEASASWAHRKLIIGNPLSNDNFFYRCCKQGDVVDPTGGTGLLRKVIHVDGRDSPNVQIARIWEAEGRSGPSPMVIPGLLTHEEFVQRETSWDEVQRTTRLHGQFHEGDQSMMFPAPWLDEAMDRNRWQQLSRSARRVEAIGIDVAAGGRDKTCWTLVDCQGVIEQIVLDLSDTMAIVGRTIALMKEHRVRAPRVAMDAGGGGKQLSDRLSEQGYHINLLGFGEASDGPQTYKNRRAELYEILRWWLKPGNVSGGFRLPPDAYELRQELTVLPYLHDSEGKTVLPPKNPTSSNGAKPSVRKLLGRSPDRADSLALAIWVLERQRRYPDFSEHVFYDPSWDQPLTYENWLAMPQEFKELMGGAYAFRQPRVPTKDLLPVWALELIGK